MSSDPQSLRAAIIIVSETAAKDASTDKCIPILEEVFHAAGDKFKVVGSTIIPDDVLQIQRAITQYSDSSEPVHLIVTSGGTGFATKDVTPEKVAVMSRPVAGVRHKTLIVTLPGSPKGAKENLESIIKLLPHACQQAFGEDSRSLHAGGLAALEKSAGTAKLAEQGHTHDHGHAHGHAHHGPQAHTRPEDRPAISNDPNAGPARRYRDSPYPMISVDAALKLISEHTPAAKVVESAVNEGIVGAVLAADATAIESVPAFRASIVDGYALIVDEQKSGQHIKGVFPVKGVSHAQASEVLPLEPGTVSRITTGAPLPPGATSVVMVEDTVLKSVSDDGKEEKEIEILTDELKAGENVREVGSDVKAGQVVMRKGEGISAIGGELGLIASVGIQNVQIYHKPVVGVLSTGDEIIPHDRPGHLRFGEVRDTNRPTLLTAIRGAGFQAIDLGIASDKPGALEQSLRDAMRAVDVIITTGGVSMGELDLLKPTIERALGGTIHFGRVSMKPGKPTTFATVPFKNNAGQDETKVIFALPGNPASAVVTFHVFVLPSLHRTSGISPAGLPKIKVVLDHSVKLDSKRNEYHRVIVTCANDGLLHATSTGFQRSSRIGSFKGANALLYLPAREGSLPRGEVVDALLMGRL